MLWLHLGMEDAEQQDCVWSNLEQVKSKGKGDIQGKGQRDQELS